MKRVKACYGHLLLPTLLQPLSKGYLLVDLRMSRFSPPRKEKFVFEVSRVAREERRAGIDLRSLTLHA